MPDDLTQFRLDGRRALACGSSQGIGRACAIQFARQGASVTLVARDPAALDRVLAELPTGPGQSHDRFTADFNDPAALAEKLQQHLARTGDYHLLLNNSGGPPHGPIVEARPDDFEAAFRRHVVCNQILVRALLPAMRDARYGRIINIISTSVKEPIPGLGVSNTIRAAVANWAKTLAGELAPYGITVNNILPGYTATSRLDELIQARARREGLTDDEVRRQMIARIPMSRLADPSEIAAAAGFLASPAASYITGINLTVDGGRTGCL